MNNLHRELAPISDAAWAAIEEEARRTFTLNVAGRRVVDVVGPGGLSLSAVGSGHVRVLDGSSEGVVLRQREVQPLVEVQVRFTVTRQAVDDVERGAGDSDWEPVKEAAKRVAFAEDRAIFTGAQQAGILGIAPACSHEAIRLPSETRAIPTALASALRALRLCGVGGPYALVLSADAYTVVAEANDDGYPLSREVDRLLGEGEGEVVWAPALEGGLLVSKRGGDYELHLGQDLSIGYLSHDADRIELYLQESLTVRVLTAEASVVLARG